MLCSGSGHSLPIGPKLSILRGASLAFSLLRLVSHKVLSWAQCCTLFSPMNCHKLYMGRAALSRRWRGDPSLAFSVRNVVGFVAMLMTAHTQWQEMIQKSCQKS